MSSDRWSARAVVLFALTIGAWGANYLFVHIGLRSTSPLWLATLRAGLGAVAFGAYLAVARGGPALSARRRLLALAIGVPNTGAFFGLWFSAENSVAPGQSAVLIYTFPLWVALLSIPLLQRRLVPAQWTAVAVGFGGVLLLSQPWTGGLTGRSVVPLCELLGAALCWALGTVLSQRLFRPSEMLRVNGLQLAGGSVVLLAATLVIAPVPLPPLSIPLVVCVAWLALVGTAFAYGVWFWLLGRVPASTLSTYTFLVPLVALGLSAAILGERLDAAQLVGVVAIVVSIYGIARTGDPARRASPGASPPPNET